MQNKVAIKKDQGAVFVILKNQLFQNKNLVQKC